VEQNKCLINVLNVGKYLSRVHPITKGCPECSGNRFSYKGPLDEKQRQKITEEVGKDINDTLIEIMVLKEKNR